VIATNESRVEIDNKAAKSMEEKTFVSGERGSTIAGWG
jgi:hypothetical protein